MSTNLEDLDNVFFDGSRLPERVESLVTLEVYGTPSELTAFVTEFSSDWMLNPFVPAEKYHLLFINNSDKVPNWPFVSEKSPKVLLKVCEQTPSTELVFWYLDGKQIPTPQAELIIQELQQGGELAIVKPIPMESTLNLQ